MIFTNNTSCVQNQKYACTEVLLNSYLLTYQFQKPQVTDTRCILHEIHIFVMVSPFMLNNNMILTKRYGMKILSKVLMSVLCCKVLN